MQNTRKLNIRKNNTTYSFNMFDSAVSGYSQYFYLRDNDKTWRIPCATGTAANSLCFVKNGTTYHTVNHTADITINFTVTDNRNVYNITTSKTFKLTTASVTTALGTSIDFWVSNDAGSSFTKVGTLSKGSTSVTINYSTTANRTDAPFQVRVTTSSSVETVVGYVDYSMSGGRVTATVTLPRALPTGVIDLEEDQLWVFHSGFKAVRLMETGQKTGVATYTGFDGNTSAGYTARLRYYPQEARLNEQTVAEHYFGNMTANGSYSTNFNLTILSSAPDIMITWTGIGSTGTRTTTVPERFMV